MNDFRYSIRGLLKAPAFTIVAVLTLALGIGATTAIFSLFDAVVLKSLPVKNPDELFIASAGHYGLYQALRKETDLFSDVTGQRHRLRNWTRRSTAACPRRPACRSCRRRTSRRLVCLRQWGGPLAPGDERPAGEPAIAVVSHAYWQRRLARDPAVVGRVVRVRSVPIEIVGVAPAGFFGEEVGASPDLWVPLTMWASIVPGRDLLNSPGTSWLRIIGRLKPGVSVPQAEARLTITFRRVLERHFRAEHVRRCSS